jgi:hypothetical protein
METHTHLDKNVGIPQAQNVFCARKCTQSSPIFRPPEDCYSAAVLTEALPVQAKEALAMPNANLEGVGRRPARSDRWLTAARKPIRDRAECHPLHTRRRSDTSADRRALPRNPIEVRRHFILKILAYLISSEPELRALVNSSDAP